MQMLYPFSSSIQQYIERIGSREQVNRCRPSKLSTMRIEAAIGKPWFL